MMDEIDPSLGRPQWNPGPPPACWPRVDGLSDIHQVRFDWDRSVTYPVNQKALNTMIALTQSHGADWVVGATEILAVGSWEICC
jgi:hypothetical protein